MSERRYRQEHPIALSPHHGIKKNTAITTNNNIYIPPTRCRTVITHRTPTEFTRQPSTIPTRPTRHFGTLIALIHGIAIPTVKGVASIADTNFVVRLKFVAPVTGIANIRVARIATDLNTCARMTAMETR